MNMPKIISLNSLFKKSLALFVAFAILISTLTVTLVTNAAVEKFWDGTKDSNLSGSGIETDPYLVETPEQLAYIVTANKSNAFKGKYFKLANDIKINDTSKANWKDSAKNWVWADFRFVGTFDGDGHTIDGLYFNGSQKRFGLFSYVGDSLIKNVRITNAYINNTYTASDDSAQGMGIISAQASAQATFDLIYIDESCYLNAPNIKGVAGIVGRSNQNITISNSAVFGTYIGASHVGAFFGTHWGGSQNISNCFTAANVPVTTSRTPTVDNVYATVKTSENWYDKQVTLLTADQMKGEAAKTNLVGLDFVNVWKTVDGGYPIIRGQEPTVNKVYWDGSKADNYAGGTGAQADPYIIEDGAQLLKMVQENIVAHSNVSSTQIKYFKITKDIYLNPITDEDMQAAITAASDSSSGSVAAWDTKGIKPWNTHTSQSSGFMGVVDGGGHTVYGVYVKSGTYSGLLGNVVGATKISDLHVKNSYVYGKCVGGIIGSAYGANTNLEVIRCSVDNVVVECKGGSDKGVRVAGIVGGGESTGKITISNCSVTNTTLKSYHSSYPGIEAGILGYIGAKGQGHTVTDCFVDDSAHPLSNATNETHFTSNMGANVTFTDVYYIRNANDTRTFLATNAKEAQFTVLTKTQMQGEAAKTNMTGLDFDNVWKTVDGGYPVLREPASSAPTPPPVDDTIWDGTWVTDFSTFEGSGTAGDPYIIKNGKQLCFAAVKNSTLNGGHHYKLGADIVLNDTSKANWEDTAKSWPQNTAKRFVGTLDGDGHTIEGLYIKSSAGRLGLFAYIGDSVVKNIKFKSASINTTTSDQGVAIVAGQTSATSTFEAIYIDKNSKIVAPNATGVGAIAARGYDNGNHAGAIIKNCAVLASITGKTSVGAFTGTYWAADAFVNINNSYTTANLPLSGNKPLTDSKNNYGLVSYEGGTKVLTLDQMKGDAAKTNMTGLDFDTVYQVVENDYPIINIREKAAPPTLPLWDGTKDYNLEGSGTPEAPYLIKTPEQLAAVVSGSNGGAFTGKHFKLANDIRIHDTTKANWKESARNWVWEDFRFVGTFDGDGHTVEGLYFKGSQKRMALFAYVGDTLIKNVKFTGAYIENTTSEEGQAIVAAQASAATDFEGIYIDETCVIKAPNVKGVAGIIGRSNQNVSIKDSAVLGTFTGASHVGAFFGTFWGGSQSISNCYTASNAPVTASRTPSVVDGVYATVSEGYFDRAVTIITAAQMKGLGAATNMPDLDFETVFELVDNGYPIINLRASAPLEPIPEGVWDGSVADSFAGGNGSPTSPYLIENGAQLRLMLEKHSTYETSSGVYFKLTKDIYLSNVLDGTPVSEVRNKKNWLEGYGSTVPSGSKVNSFNGSLDGNGHVIYGMYIKGAYSAGLFPAISGQAEIKNLGMENILITGGNGFAGALAGQAFYYSNAKGNAKISYCYVKDAVIGEDANVESAAGFVGATVDGSINFKDCYSYNLALSCWDSRGLPGGFTGTAWSGGALNFENCFTVGYFITNQNVSKAVCKNVYTDTARPAGNTTEGVTVLTAAQMKGAAAKTNLKGFDFDKDWSVTADSYPVLRNGAGQWQYDTTTEAGKVWNGKIALTYASGSGSETDPFIIKTGGQLALLANEAIEGKTAGKHYKLAADIILNDTSKAGWESRANGWYTGGWDQGFKGHLDGDYHIISGLFYNNTHETYTNENTRNAGLFASLSVGAVVEKLGIVNSSLTHTHATAGRRVGAIAGYIDHYNGDNTPYEQYPIIRECFADTSVYLSGSTCGGLVGGVLRPVRVENCFFTGTVAGTGYGIFGYSKMGYLTKEVLVKNVYAANSDFAIISNNSYNNVVYENCYSSAAQDTVGITRLFIDRMIGKNAKGYMKGFDFDKLWVARGENETPGLRGFKADAYSNLMNPKDITVSFETNCELEVDSITGKAYSKLTLPTLEREGYIFEGWYAYPELDTSFTYDYFPTFDTILYAKWTLSGFVQDFENYEDSIYDYHEGIEYYRPTTPGYTATYVHGGAKSIHRTGGINDYLDFLLFYKEELEVGKTYKMVFYTTTDQDSASTKLSLVHLDWPDVYSDNAGVQAIGTLNSLKKGKWTEHTFTFVAKSKWIAIRTEGEDSVYFDDFTLYNTNEKADEVGTDDKAPGKGLGRGLLITVIVVGALAVIGGGAAATVVLIRKRKK
ncbi:MAG: InlB B-repeat-containing protein [Clostridia bacterium]|nr:InlB B-repeat-containing protein [Clostridia bacterium]